MICTEVDCAKPITARGLCGAHYARARRSGLLAPRPPRLCSIEGCDGRHHQHSYCVKHFFRWRKHGDPHFTATIVGDDLARFWSHVDKGDGSGCWLWTSGTDRKGYGRFTVGGRDGKQHPAHRWIYQRTYGPIPDGMEVDHVRARGCTNRHCVNPTHLEAVTHAENLRRRGRAD